MDSRRINRIERLLAAAEAAAESEPTVPPFTDEERRQALTRIYSTGLRERGYFDGWSEQEIQTYCRQLAIERMEEFERTGTVEGVKIEPPTKWMRR